MIESTDPEARRLLIVDDESMIVDLLTIIATRMDERVVADSCNNGLSVQALAERFHPHLVLLDLKMPGADGFEVMRRLSASDQTRSIPVVIMTGLNTKETRDRVFAAGAVELLPKPLEVEPVRDVLRRRLLN